MNHGHAQTFWRHFLSRGVFIVTTADMTVVKPVFCSSQPSVWLNLFLQSPASVAVRYLSTHCPVLSKLFSPHRRPFFSRDFTPQADTGVRPIDLSELQHGEACHSCHGDMAVGSSAWVERLDDGSLQVHSQACKWNVRREVILSHPDGAACNRGTCGVKHTASHTHLRHRESSKWKKPCSPRGKWNKIIHLINYSRCNNNYHTHRRSVQFWRIIH